MAAIRIDAFKGIAPAISDTKLADGAATEMENAKIVASSIYPHREPYLVEPFPTGTKSFFRTEWSGTDYFLTSTADSLSYVNSPVPQDTYKRVYFAGGTEPRYTYEAVAKPSWNSSNSLAVNPVIPEVSYRLGVPYFGTGPDAQPSGTITDAAIEFTTFYVFTIVTLLGEEGIPSPISNVCTYKQGQTRTVTVPSLPTYSNADYALGSGAKWRIYRTAAGSARSSFLFVDEKDLTTTSYVDSKSDDELGEEIKSTFYYPPFNDDTTYAPDGPLKKIVSMANGYLAGFAGRTVCFSEQYLPHAWSPQNYLMTESNIVTIQEAPFGLVVLTETNPYVAVGSSPDAMSLQKLDIDQACVSAKSVSECGGAVLFASPDGIVSIEGNTATLVTEGLITRDQWQKNFWPETIIGASHEDLYYAFYNSGTQTSSYNSYTNYNDTRKALVYDKKSTEAPFSILDVSATCAYKSSKEDRLYISQNNNLMIFAEGQDALYTWTSKKFFIPIDTNLAWGRVVGYYPQRNYVITRQAIAANATEFLFGETITGSLSNATATVERVSSTEIKINNANGVFQTGETITGSTSGATSSTLSGVNDAYLDNPILEIYGSEEGAYANPNTMELLQTVTIENSNAFRLNTLVCRRRMIQIKIASSRYKIDAIALGSSRAEV